MSHSKMLAILIVVVAAAIALIYWFAAYPQNLSLPFFENEVADQDQNINAAEESQITSPEEIPLPAVDGGINSTVDAIIKSVSVEEAAILSEDSDNSFINSDSQEISDFGQSYNENDF